MKMMFAQRKHGMVLLAVISCWGSFAGAAASIDRQALVTRHHPVLNSFDIESPLSVGNGEFAFTADATGLQTFPEAFEKTIPLATLSQWAWHTLPNSNNWHIERFPFAEFDSHGRPVGYADIPGNRRTPEISWLRGNPHRLHLGRIGFRLRKADGTAATTNDLTEIRQTLDLWNGVLHSCFSLEGQPVEVETLCHPARDLLAVSVTSSLLPLGRIGIELHFPYGTGATTAADWTKPDAHETLLEQSGPGAAVFRRRLDQDAYEVAARWTPDAAWEETARHQFLLLPSRAEKTLTLVCHFSKTPVAGTLPDVAETRAAACQHWPRFWSTGGALDLSGSTDPRWRELERRIVLSQYLTAIQCAGSFPPQESGLTFNSWEGKFHLEMHWWHAVHFALWDRLALLEKSLPFYETILPPAQATARRQGYDGARWPKMTDPSGAESPSTVGPFLIWQQPHPIYYAELCYRAHPDRATLVRYEKTVAASAEFMASYAAWEGQGRRYVLGPPLQCAQERFPKESTFNPTFELTYWRWGLETAQRWRERLGLAREERWDRVLQQLARPPVAEGRYLFTESTPDTYRNARWVNDHPSVLASLGMLPGPGIDRATMRRTLDWIWTHWNWQSTWGWDYPLVAMAAARLGDPEKAVEALLMDTPKNHYRRNGHNHQRPGLAVYLPGNGGLLTAVAMMAAGWDGCPSKHAPGFPDDGRWRINWEGLRPMP